MSSTSERDVAPAFTFARRDNSLPAPVSAARVQLAQVSGAAQTTV